MLQDEPNPFDDDVWNDPPSTTTTTTTSATSATSANTSSSIAASTMPTAPPASSAVTAASAASVATTAWTTSDDDPPVVEPSAPPSYYSVIGDSATMPDSRKSSNASTGMISTAARPPPATPTAAASSVVATSRAATAAVPRSSDRHKTREPAPTSDGGEPVLLISISQPEKHGEGLDSFTTYAITTKTNLSSYAQPETTVRRRYQDFLWLRNELMCDHTGIILPPLPEKHVLGYLDRFKPVFIEKRQSALQRFLDRVSVHPNLYSSKTLRTFLEAKTWGLETAKQLRKPASLLENIGDSLMTAFSKARTPDPQFAAISESITKLEEHLQSLERFHLRLLKRQTDIAADLTELGSSFTLLSSTETTLSQPLASVGQSTEKIVGSLTVLNEVIELDVMERIRDYLLYCQSVKAVLHARDEKQYRMEDLQTQMESLKGLNAGSDSKNWLSAKEADPEKLKSKFAETEAAYRESQEALEDFSDLILTELELFNEWKVRDLKAVFRDYAIAMQKYYSSSLSAWEDVMPSLNPNVKTEPAPSTAFF